MSGAWGEDPWRRYPYRWHTDRGWTDHVSDGVTEARDTPGARAAAPAASRPATATYATSMQATATPAAWTQATAAPATATQSAFRPTASNAAATGSGPRATAAATATAAEASTAATATAATAARRQSNPSGPSNAPMRWPLAVLGMVLSFALGGWIFGRGDGTEGADTASSSPAVVDSTVDTASGLVPADQAANVPTTLPGMVPVATIEPIPGEPPAATVSPDAMSNAELAARNDGLIDDAEFVVVGATIELFGWSVPTRDELAMLGWAGCGVAQTAATRDELEAGIEAQMAGSTLPPGQFGVIVGVAAGVMCMDSFVNLGMMPLA